MLSEGLISLACYINAIVRTFTGSELEKVPVEGNVLTGTNSQVFARNRKSTPLRTVESVDYCWLLSIFLRKTMKGRGIINHQLRAKCESRRASFAVPTTAGQTVLRVKKKRYAVIYVRVFSLCFSLRVL